MYIGGLFLKSKIKSKFDFKSISKQVCKARQIFWVMLLLFLKMYLSDSGLLHLVKIGFVV